MAVRSLRDTPDQSIHTGFLLAEDEMVKSYLTGITIPSFTYGGHTVPAAEVKTWFRWPMAERQIIYPFITIDMISAEPAYELFTSVYQIPPPEQYRPSVSPDMPPLTDTGLRAWTQRNLLPFYVQYQVVHHSRFAIHDRYLQSTFRTDVFPPRPFWLWCDTDETWRRTELIAATQLSDQTETNESGNKRIFRKVYTVRVMAEIPQDRIMDSEVYKVLRVVIPVVDRDFVDTYRDTILNASGSTTQEQRDLAGEYFRIHHQGEEVPSL